MKYCLFIFFVFFLFGCSNRDKNNKSLDLGRYVYVDRDKCLHIDRNCVKFIISLENSQGIVFIDTAKLTDNCFIDFCSHCVNDKCYEKIENVLNHNRESGSLNY